MKHQLVSWYRSSGKVSCRISQILRTPHYRNQRRFPTSGVFVDLVTAPGFKPGETSEKRSGGFDSHPLPLVSDLPTPKNPASHLNAVICGIFSCLGYYCLASTVGLCVGLCRIWYARSLVHPSRAIQCRPPPEQPIEANSQSRQAGAMSGQRWPVSGSRWAT